MWFCSLRPEVGAAHGTWKGGLVCIGKALGMDCGLRPKFGAAHENKVKRVMRVERKGLVARSCL